MRVLFRAYAVGSSAYGEGRRVQVFQAVGFGGLGRFRVWGLGFRVPGTPTTQLIYSHGNPRPPQKKNNLNPRIITGPCLCYNYRNPVGVIVSIVVLFFRFTRFCIWDLIG